MKHRIDIRGVLIPNDYKWIYDFFEMDATCPRDVQKVLDKAQLGDEVEVYINSGGGIIDVGSEIYTMLRGRTDTKIYITGEACSAASVVAMAAYCEMSPTALMMVHCVSTETQGNHNAMEHTAEVLRTADRALSTAYMAKTGKSEAEVLDMMEKETWLTAEQAKEKGKKVLVIDKRPHIAGNVYTEDVEGIHVHKYGAHIFHTNNKEVWDYITKFAEFNRFTNSPVANYKGELYSMPFNMYTFNKMWGVVTPEEAAAKIEEQKKAVRSGYDMDILPTDIITYEKDTLDLLDDLNSSNQKMVKITFLITCYGRSKRALENITQRVSGIIQQANCNLRCMQYLQEQGLMASAPIGCNETGIERDLTTKSTAILVPFCTQELFMPAPAIYYGLNALSNNMIMADRKRLRTPNGVILGTPGSGKSFSAKREILSCFLMTKDDIVVCDPEGEYFALVGALHGQVVRLATNSKDYLNPMDIQLSHKGDKEALKLKSDFIITLCDLIAGGKNGLENDEKGIIDECIRHIYDDYFENPVPENMPVLEDLYNALLEHKNKKAERIANSLVLYVHGSQNYFNHRTNVDSQNRIMCFDIRDLGNQLKELGMLIVQDAVWNRVSQNRERKIATRYYCDEFHLLLKEKQTAVYSVEIWKRFRKWGGIPTGLTQNVGDFLKSEEIEGILGNSDFIYLLNQNAKDQAILADKLGLSEKQLAHVTNSEPGCGLILFDNVVIPFVDKYPSDTKTYAIMNTRPEESVRQEVE